MNDSDTQKRMNEALLSGLQKFLAWQDANLKTWTPLEESDPPESGRYLFTYGASSLHCTCRQVCIGYFEQTRQGYARIRDDRGAPLLYVLAWAKLPEPYWDNSEGKE
ncbi:MAG: hypothetical protein E6R03_17055 [Hyphomicrobiaceae bacterium]|nr:MAG: hypothetical protein E6R03_17055 [Hyphomicrobiaceae bacterium]